MTSFNEAGLARHSDPQTSHDAAESIDASLLERLVVDVLKKNGAMTSEQVAIVLNMNLVSISPRFRPLATKGLIFDTGRKARNRSGKSAILWQAVK